MRKAAMFKTIIITLFILLSGWAYANQPDHCPSYSDWIGPFEKWDPIISHTTDYFYRHELGPIAKNNLWQENMAMSFVKENVMPNNKLIVIYYPGDSEDTGDDDNDNDPIGDFSCEYTLNSGAQISAVKDIPFGTPITLSPKFTAIPNKPFTGFDKFLSWSGAILNSSPDDRICETTAAEPEKCGWE